MLACPCPPTAYWPVHTGNVACEWNFICLLYQRNGCVHPSVTIPQCLNCYMARQNDIIQKNVNRPIDFQSKLIIVINLYNTFYLLLVSLWIFFNTQMAQSVEK